MGSAIGGFKDALASVINRVRIVRGGHDGRRPLKPVIEWGRTPRVGEFGPHGNALDLVRAPVKARDVALIVAGIHNVRVGGIGGNVSRFPAADRVPFVAANRAFIAAAGNRHGGIILLRAVDVVRRPRVGDDVVELRGRLVVLACPGLAAIQADGNAPIVRGDHSFCILRIDPQAVIVAMRNFNFIEVAATIGGLEELHVGDVNSIRILRIGDYVHVVPRALKQAVAAVYEIPSVAAVIGAVESTGFLGFDNRVDSVGVRRDRQPDTTVGSLRKTVLHELFPRCAAIRGTIHATARAAARERPRSSSSFPQRGK